MKTYGNLALREEPSIITPKTQLVGIDGGLLEDVPKIYFPQQPGPYVVPSGVKLASVGRLELTGLGPGLIALAEEEGWDWTDEKILRRFLNGLGITFGGDLATLIAINANLANVGDATGLRGSTVAGTLAFSLHSQAPASPHVDATSFELGYPNYARPTGARSGVGFVVVSTNVLENAAAVTWAAVGTTGSTFTANNWSLSLASSGAAHIVLTGTVSTPPTFGQGVSPVAAQNVLTAAFQ